MGGRAPRVTATPAKSTKRPHEGGRGGRAGEHRRWDFDRPLAPASQAAAPAERTSPRKKGFLSSLVHVDAQRLTTLRAARVRPSKRHSWSPSFGSASMARLPYTAAPISNPSRGGSFTGKPDELRSRMRSCVFHRTPMDLKEIDFFASIELHKETAVRAAKYYSFLCKESRQLTRPYKLSQIESTEEST